MPVQKNLIIIVYWFIYPKKKRKKKGQKSPYTVWRWLKILEKTQYLSIETRSKYSRVTIDNWTRYQIDEFDPAQQREQQMSNRRAAGDHQARTNKNDRRMNKNKQEGVFVKPFVSQIDPAEIEAELAERRRLRREFNL